MQMAKLSPQDKILGLKSDFLPNFYYLYTQQFKHHPIGLRHRRAMFYKAMLQSIYNNQSITQ